MVKGWLFIVSCLACISVSAKDIGNYGQVFPVIEEDIRQVIFKRLHEMELTGELAHHQRDIAERVANHILRPTPVGLSTTVKPSIYHVDPTIVLNHDVYSPDNTLIAKAGTRINPFERVQFSKALFFFNADDKHQTAWVEKHYQDYTQVKFILTGGDIKEASELLGRVYFDLGGQFSTQLQIKHVPSVATQDGLLWKIQEIGVHDV